MDKDRQNKSLSHKSYPELTDRDIFEAMKTIPGYLDITPADFKEIYLLAFQQAIDRLSHSVTARDIMTETVVRVKPDTPIEELAERMAQEGVSGVPVVDDENRVLGIISEKDFLDRLSDGTPKNVMGVIARCLQVQKCLAMPLRRQKARDLMSSPVISLRPDSTLKEITETFSGKAINRAPVLDAQGRLSGIVSRGDIIKATRW
jgi:CBS domain-containing membrane protein